MKIRTIITANDHNKFNYESLFYIRKVRRLEKQVQKLKAWILKNLDPCSMSEAQKMELYQLLAL